jgi:hypothetical protein
MARIDGLSKVGTELPRWETRELDAERRAFLHQRRSDIMSPNGLPASLDAVAEDDFRHAALEVKLLLDEALRIHGGHAVVMPALDDHVDRIVLRGVVLDGAGARQVPGETSRCHQNSAAFAAARPAERGMMTGYALSEDGAWRAHSWGVEWRDGAARLAETTEPMLAYAGSLRTPAELAEIVDPPAAPSAASRWRPCARGDWPC